MPISEKELKSMLEAKFKDADIQITDLAGDEDHYQVSISAIEFAGLSMIDQHKLVMDALCGIVGTTLHALSIKTSLKK